MRVTPETFAPENPQGFIVIEGVNGSGKSTLQKKLHQWVTETGREAVSSFEPGGTPLGTSLRKLLLEQKSSERSPRAEALLFSADRAEHVETVIKPALTRDAFVLVDRYYYSTIAFQGYGHEHPIDPLMEMSDLATSGLKPDLVLLLDLSAERGLQRNAGKEEVDSFEQEAIDFHQRLRDGFLELADTLPEPFAIIDAELSSDKVYEEALRYISKIVR